MRRRNLLICVGWLAATVAAPWLCAQNSGGQSTQNGAPVADRFVSAPGQRVSTPGPMVAPMGQRVAPMGQGIAPVPGVIVPFHSQSQQSFGAAQVGVAGPGAGIRPGRRYHDQQKYRPEYGVAEGYALPYVVSGGYGTPAVSGGGVSSTNSSESRSMMGVAGQGEASLRDGPAPVADAPSGNRPPYRGETDRQSEAASTGPNVIQSHEPVLVLVMKNGGRRKVRNYALTPQTLIDLDEAASGKEVEIPLGEINLAATKKAAAEAGLSFAVPRG